MRLFSRRSSDFRDFQPATLLLRLKEALADRQRTTPEASIAFCRADIIDLLDMLLCGEEVRGSPRVPPCLSPCLREGVCRTSLATQVSADLVLAVRDNLLHCCDDDGHWRRANRTRMSSMLKGLLGSDVEVNRALEQLLLTNAGLDGGDWSVEDSPLNSGVLQVNDHSSSNDGPPLAPSTISSRRGVSPPPPISCPQTATETAAAADITWLPTPSSKLDSR